MPETKLTAWERQIARLEIRGAHRASAAVEHQPDIDRDINRIRERVRKRVCCSK
ncbi:hypothetical protein [Streptomyces sp. NPDC048489]|uniref:hypothetical protein n=1 Tax=Streptomyces sp. NPDC048489 TaxID=3154504 RepID=UPI00344540C6